MQVLRHIHRLVTLQQAANKQGKKPTEDDLSVIKNAAIVIKDAKILWVGEDDKLNEGMRECLKNSDYSADDFTEISLRGCTVLPGLIDCHTHTTFAGSRAHEFEWKLQGQTYQEIAKKGGGIVSTVKATRDASEKVLFDNAETRINRFLRQGVTTLEMKSGYGLSKESELKILKVQKSLQSKTKIRLVSTYMGAHTKSPDAKSFDEYLKECIELIPEIAKKKLASRVDIFIEKGFFTSKHAELYFKEAQKYGLNIAAHVEQMSLSKGLDMALKYKAQSIEHAVYSSTEQIQKLAKSKTVAVLLPASDFYLKMKYPPARKMIDKGVSVALSTDFNPGTSPTQDINFTGLLARLEMKMSLPEVITAWTVNAAAALGLQEKIGSIEVGKSADLAVFDCHWRELFYRVGEWPLAETWGQGQIIYKKMF